MSTWKTIQEPSRHSEEEEKKNKKFLVSFCPDADYFFSKSGTNTVRPPTYHHELTENTSMKYPTILGTSWEHYPKEKNIFRGFCHSMHLG